MQVDYVIAESADKGRGIFSNQFIRKGSVVWKFQEDSALVLDEDSARRHYANLSPCDKKRFLEVAYGDANFADGNHVMIPMDDSRYTNHSDEPNCVPHKGWSKWFYWQISMLFMFLWMFKLCFYPCVSMCQSN